MGVEPYVVTPSLAGILGQRLVRQTCESCKEEYEISEDLLKQYFYWTTKTEFPEFYKGAGCEACQNTGYKGRIGIHEFIAIDFKGRELIIKRVSYTELAEYAFNNDYQDMRFDGFSKVIHGLTTIDEVIRVTTIDQ